MPTPECRLQVPEIKRHRLRALGFLLHWESQMVPIIAIDPDAIKPR